ncbi:MAG: hypothetical protein AB7O97_09270 [Planctomycetota bacterium]
MSAAAQLARDRMIEAGLAELFGGREAPDVAAAVQQRLRDADPLAPPSRLRRLAVAAVVLFGLCVLAAVLWTQAGGPDREPVPEPVQEPEAAPLELEPLPPPAVWSGWAQPDSIDGEVVSLAMTVDVFSRVADLGRLQRLRSVDLYPGFGVHGEATGRPESSGEAYAARLGHVLVELATLPRLERVGMTLLVEVPAAALETLTPSPAVRQLCLRLQRPLAAADVRALARFPRLESLQLLGPGVEAGSVAMLGSLPRLRELEIGSSEPPRIPERALVGSMRPQFASTVVELPSPGLTIAVAAAIGELPHLERLVLRNCAVAPGAFERLPDDLHGLGLRRCTGDRGHGLRSDDLRSLGRLSQLRWLSVDVEPTAAAAIADLLPRLQLREFRFLGQLPLRVRETLAAQRSLHRVVLASPAADDIPPLLRLPHLRELRLVNALFPPSTLAPLRVAPALRRLELLGGTIRPDEVPPLGPSIRLVTY